MKAQFFSTFREAVGRRELEIQVPEGATVATLVRELEAAYPSLSPHTGFMMIAVNAEYVERNHPLRDGDEVTLVPPVSGG